MDELDTATPIKLRMQGDELGIATPSGGLIFNPFHKEFLSRVGQVTFSPGIFSYTASPMDNREDSCKSTPNRLSLPFVLSPETQGMLFPADIDENPILQLKLQEKLDTQCDEDVQNSIHSFFKSHLIAPSPDTVDGSAARTIRCNLPRTSSLLPTATPKTRKKSMCPVPSAPTSKSTGTQTTLTIPLDCDFEALVKEALANRVCEPNAVSANDAPVTTGLPLDPTLPHFCTATPDKDGPVRRATDYPDERAVRADRQHNHDCHHQHDDGADEDEDDVDEAYSTGFLCTSCHQPHAPPVYSRRSLFSESSGTMDETVNNRFEEDFPAQQQTLMAATDSEPASLELALPAPPSFKLSSTVMEPAGHPNSVPGSVACSAPDSLMRFERMANSFGDEATGLNLIQTPVRMRSACCHYQSHENVFDSNLDGSDSDGNPRTAVAAAVGRRPGDARASSPSPPVYGRRHGSAFRGTTSMELGSVNMSHDDMSFQPLHVGTSPPTFHINMSFQSPDLSPILPTTASIATRPFSPTREVPGEQEGEESCFELGEGHSSFLLRTPAVRLFGSPDRPISPILPARCPIRAGDRLSETKDS